MGADGGLTWMYVREEAKWQRAVNLLAPLGYFDAKFRDEDSAYIREHRPFDHKVVLVARYGTDLDHDGMREVYEILAYMEDDERTFEEVALDIATRPDWLMFSMETFEQAVMRTCDSSAWYDYFRIGRYWSDRDAVIAERPAKRIRVGTEAGLKHLGIIRNMKVDDWTAELKRLLHWERYETVETWT